jgi:hypothetical protein
VIRDGIYKKGCKVFKRGLETTKRGWPQKCVAGGSKWRSQLMKGPSSLFMNRPVRLLLVSAVAGYPQRQMSVHALEDFMNGMTIVGVVLIILAIIGLTVGGVTYTADKDTTEIGPVDITVTDKDRINIPRPLAIAGLIAGGLLVMAGMRRRSV